jgi:hypothetical protein
MHLLLDSVSQGGKCIDCSLSSLSAERTSDAINQATAVLSTACAIKGGWGWGVNNGEPCVALSSARLIHAHASLCTLIAAARGQVSDGGSGGGDGGICRPVAPGERRFLDSWEGQLQGIWAVVKEAEDALKHAVEGRQESPWARENGKAVDLMTQLLQRLTTAHTPARTHAHTADHPSAFDAFDAEILGRETGRGGDTISREPEIWETARRLEGKVRRDTEAWVKSTVARYSIKTAPDLPALPWWNFSLHLEISSPFSKGGAQGRNTQGPDEL